jgi:hypothetical protein
MPTIFTTRPSSPGKFVIETGDDFVLTQQTSITGAAFTGLIPLGVTTSDITNVVVEVYRVFPADSNVGRTSGPPTFSTNQVPTRVNSPSDVEVTDRNSSNGSLNFIPIVLQSSFTAKNSVQPGGIPTPFIKPTGGDGPVTGQETQIAVSFTTPFDLGCGSLFLCPPGPIRGRRRRRFLGSVINASHDTDEVLVLAPHHEARVDRVIRQHGFCIGGRIAQCLGIDCQFVD